MRKYHLKNTKTGNPACTGRRFLGGSEHIALPTSEFKESAMQCEKCKASKLFAFLNRSKTNPD